MLWKLLGLTKSLEEQKWDQIQTNPLIADTSLPPLEILIKKLS